MCDIDILKGLYYNYCGCTPESVDRLPGAGSSRKYFRLKGKRIVSGESRDFSCIGVVGDSMKECRAFVRLAKVFAGAGLNVPVVYASAPDDMYYIQQDLGHVSLFDIIRSRSGDDEMRISKMVEDCLAQLAVMQALPETLWKPYVEYDAFGYRQAMWDLNYFKYEYLKPSGIGFDEEALENDFELMAKDLIDISGDNYGFMYRDFQSRNVMTDGGTPYFIDFQGGRPGPGVYDAISFLWQAKAAFSDGFRLKMLNHYFEQRCRITGCQRDRSHEKKLVGIFALFRTMQVLGAYGLRGLVEHKSHFIESIPGALANLERLVAGGAADRYPELKRVCKGVCEDPRFKKEDRTGLVVKVFSFSYKKGYPSDYSGNGGGFMFDCRGLHNPGRYEEYKSFTGMDLPVIEFLRRYDEVTAFIDSAVSVVSPSIETYLRRGFTDLQIGFGCTGGQHRSVYCAENVAKSLVDKFPEAEIRIIHREQGINKCLNKK